MRSSTTQRGDRRAAPLTYSGRLLCNARRRNRRSLLPDVRCCSILQRREFVPTAWLLMDPSIIWDSEDDEDGNYHHLVTDGHGITQEEVDEVLCSHHSEAITSRTTGNPICFGWTTTGK